MVKRLRERNEAKGELGGKDDETKTCVKTRHTCEHKQHKGEENGTNDKEYGGHPPPPTCSTQESHCTYKQEARVLLSKLFILQPPEYP